MIEGKAQTRCTSLGVAADYEVGLKTYVRGKVFHRDVDAT